LSYIAEIALDNVCTAGVLGQCATADAECQVDTDNATKCLCKSTHFKDGSLCTLSKYQLGDTISCLMDLISNPHLIQC